jgi:hypothetical protein
MDNYFQIETLVSDFSEPEQGWFAAYRAKFPCLHRESPVAIDVKLSYIGEDLPMNFVGGVVINYARLDLLGALGAAVERCLTLAGVFDRAGRALPNYRTLGAPNSLPVRGGPESTRQFCPTCGTFLYCARGKRYVLRNDLTGQPLYHSGDLGLIVTEELAECLRHRKWKKLYFRKLPVLDEPRDGLPVDLRELRPEDLHT